METRFRIIRKERDGVTLSASRNAETVKIGWLEFTTNYIVRDELWVIPTKKFMQKIEAAESHVSKAASLIKRSNGDEIPFETSAAIAIEVKAVAGIAGCTTGEAMMFIWKKIDSGKHQPKKGIEDTGGTRVLEGNKMLLELKDKYKKEGK